MSDIAKAAEQALEEARAELAKLKGEIDIQRHLKQIELDGINGAIEAAKSTLADLTAQINSKTELHDKVVQSIDVLRRKLG